MPQGQVEQFADYVQSMANSRATTRVCRMRQNKGVLTESECEAIRHLALHEFDRAADSPGITNEALAGLDARRALVEKFWDEPRR